MQVGEMEEGVLGTEFLAPLHVQNSHPETLALNVIVLAGRVSGG